MKKLSSSLLNMVLVLTIIAIIAGAGLAAVNSATAPQIEKINKENLEKGIKKVLCNEKTVVESTDTVKAKVDGKDKQYIVYNTKDGKAVLSSENGFGGELQVLVGFNATGEILGYTILQSAETPGLGAKADEWFQKGNKGDIIGMNAGDESFAVSKDGGKVDAITASTITSRAFLKAIRNAYANVISDADAVSSATTQESAVQGCSKKCESCKCKEGNGCGKCGKNEENKDCNSKEEACKKAEDCKCEAPCKCDNNCNCPNKK